MIESHQIGLQLREKQASVEKRSQVCVRSAAGRHDVCWKTCGAFLHW